MKVSVRLCLLGALLLPSGIHAQSSSERQRLDRWRDSLALVRDTTSLLKLESDIIERARIERTDPMLHLQLGLLALRLAELRPESEHLNDAMGEFDWAAELQPRWPWPWFGIGLAESRGANRAGGTAGGLFVMLGLDRDQRAGTAFRRALEADPSFVSGILEFGRVALAQRIGAPVESALRSLRVATATPIGWDPDLLLVRGRLERLAHHPDSALLMFRRAERLGAQNGLAWLEIARTLPLISDSADAQLRAATTRAYLRGAHDATAEVLSGYLRDLEPIAPESFLAQLRDETPAVRVATLDTFWRNRDANDLREPGARLTEHYRRWSVAMAEFRLPPFKRRYLLGLERYRSGDAEFDDRGMVYLRQGEPTARIIWPKNRPAFHISSLDRSYGAESWRYDRPDGTLELHFLAREDPQDFRLIDGPTGLDVALDALPEHAHELPGIARLLRADRVSSTWVGEEVRSQSLRALAIATQTDRWVRDYDTLLSGRTQWWAVGAAGDTPLVHLVYALDADAVRRQSAERGGGKVPLHIRASVLRDDGRPVSTVDTVQWINAPSSAARQVAGHLVLPAAPGRQQVRAGLEVGPHVGAVFPVDSILVPRPNGRRLDLSALVIGVAGRSLSWHREGADPVWIDAGGAFTPRDTLRLYLEAYGVGREQPTTVAITLSQPRSGIARLFGGRRAAITLTETVSATSSSRLAVERAIPLDGLERGSYQLEVVVTSGGRSVTRHRGLLVQ